MMMVMVQESASSEGGGDAGPGASVPADHAGAMLPVASPAASRAGRSADAHSAPHEGVAPGQYWRPRKNLKRSNSTRANHPAMPKGTVLLVTQVEYADGVEHSVHLAAHPTWDDYRISHLHIDDFLDSWERAWDADRIREAEMHALGLEMQATQAAMLAGPPPGEADALLRYDPTQNQGGTGRELATSEGLQAMVARAGALQEQAKAQAAWIKQHTSALGEHGQTLARYHNERGAAMLARAKQQLKGVDKVFELVKNLRLYTGEDVGVDVLRNGGPAAVEAPITIYQDVLALDEETGALLDQGGLDHRDIHTLGTLLDSGALRERLIPADRGMVLCRFRRADKAFFSVADNAAPSDVLRAAIANYEENKAAKAIHLLYRDGERFYLISHSDLFAGMTQLMPSTAEQNEQFIRTAWSSNGRGERITPDDLDYAEAQRQQLGALNAYARVLVLLWGLGDRTELFASTSIPRYANWLDPGFQAAHLRLVSQDIMLGEEREDFAAFRGRHNAYLAAGSQVAVHVDQLFGEDTAPGCFGPSYYDHHQSRTRRNQVYRYEGDRVVIDRVRCSQGKAYIEITARYDGYSKVERETITTKLWLLDLCQVLVLDRLHGPDLDYYLESRRQRRQYAEYLELFRTAREHVRARDCAEGALRSALAHAVTEARIAHDPEALGSQITDALATVRAATRGAFADSAVTRKKALNTLHALLTSGEERVAATAELAQSLGRRPLRLVHAGSGAWKLYMDAIDADRDPRLAHHPWVMLAEIGFSALGATLRGELEPVVLRAVAGEQVIHEWPDTKPCQTPSSESWQQLQRALSRVRETAEALPDRLTIAHAAYAIAWKAMLASKRRVDRPYCGVAIGTVIVHRVEPQRDDSVHAEVKGARILVFSADALSLAYHWGDSALKERCREAIRRIYANVASNLERLETGELFTHLRLSRLSAFATGLQDAVFVSDQMQSLPDRACWGRPSAVSAAKLRNAGARACLQLTSLNRVGAEVCPELVEHCEAPAW